MADVEAFYRIHLAAELKRRKTKNPRYSQRAFATFLGIHNGFLSKLLKSKALLSLDTAADICKRLKLTGDARTEFLTSAAEEQKCLALYLLDPTLTDCDPAQDTINKSPARR